MNPAKPTEPNMFCVYDNDKPASKEGFAWAKAECWSNHRFETFEEALSYANDWLGEYGGVKLELNKPYSYSGYGDTIVIKEA